MKKITLLIAVLLLTISTFSQQGINYKAVISDNGNVLQNQSVSVRFSILEGGTTMVYEENHTATTDANGIIIVNIGEGTATSGDFTTINWSQEQYLKVEIDTGSGYADFGTTAFKSVPYAKFAENGGATEINDLTDAKTDATSVFLGANSGINDDGTDNYNVGIGIEALYTNISGYSNVANGTAALFSNTTGYENVANGFWALRSNTTGRRNVSNGYKSLYSNTTGSSNVANGTVSLYNNTTGSDNVANGPSSLYSNTEGYSNVANGTVALYSNTTGFDNVANGYKSLYSNTTGSSNVANGVLALFFNTSGSSNVANGYAALYNNTEGNGNVGIGYQAGFNETGSNKLYIENSDSTTPLIGGDFATDEVTINGSLAIKDGTEGAGKIFTSDATGKGSWQTSSVYATEINDLTDAISDGSSVFLGANSGINDGSNFNVGIGIEALKTNTIGYYNVANGYQALYSNTTGDKNVANGVRALYSNTGGDKNVANGYEALYSSTTGSFNLANGCQSLYSNTTGFCNVANGFGALYDNTTGFRNVANGYQALVNNTTGADNVANGCTALRSNTTGSSNVANGYQALYFNTEGDGNVGIGYQVGLLNETGGGNIFIGYQAGFNELGSNKLYIENTDSSTPLIGGDFATDEVTINGTLKTLKTTGSNVLTVESLDSGANIYVKSTGTNNPSTHYYLDNTFKASTGFNVEQSAYYIYQGGNVFFKNGNILPASHITKDLGASGTAWNNVYAHNYVTQGSAAYTDRSVTEELMNHPPMAKKEGDFDAKSNGLYELNPQSLPANLHTDNGLKIDEISTYNYKANYEQQVLINEQQVSIDKQRNTIEELKTLVNKQQVLLEQLIKEMNSLKSKK